MTSHLRAAHVVFAVTMIALGVLGFIERDFVVVWQPVPPGIPARELLINICALIPLICGAALFWKRTAGPAAGVLFAYLLIWLAVFRLPGLFRSLATGVYWAASSTAVMVTAACLLFASLARGWEGRYVGFFTDEPAVRAARALYGIAVMAFGMAHLQNIAPTAALVPGWLPAPTAWAYVTGATFVAAGIAIVSGVHARLAAVLCAWQIGLFLALVWVPRLAAGSLSTFQRGEVITTWVLMVAAWVVADSYRGGRPNSGRFSAH